MDALTGRLLYGMVAGCVLMVFVLLKKLYHQKKRLQQILCILTDIENGNLDRKFLAHENDADADICYKMNEIVLSCKNKLSAALKNEKGSRQLLTNLSHDVKTPITSLMGYLDAVKSGVVSGTEKDEYIEIASCKAHELKDYIDELFEWVKLSSHERSYHFERADINELTRSILVGLIPLLEENEFTYEIEIDEEEIFAAVDVSGYTRMINNLISNAIEHSGGNHVVIKVSKEKSDVRIAVSDNGKGIAQSELPFIFDRLYKIDTARTRKGSGLGLYIVKELAAAHHATVVANSIPCVKTDFILSIPCSW